MNRMEWNNFQTKHIYDSYITINMVLALVFGTGFAIDG